MAVETFSTPFPETDHFLRPSNRRSHAVYVSLQRDIVLGTLAPGRVLTEMDLAQRFQCSQGTVREALIRLSNEGLVNRQPHRGTLVAPCASDDAFALIAVRRHLECDYVSRIVERSGADLISALVAQLEAMRTAAAQDDEYRLSVHDRAFHTALFEAADLPLLVPLLERCLIHNHRFKISSLDPNRSLQETAERHVPIIEAVEAEDARHMRDVLDHHIATIVDVDAELIRGRHT